MRLLMRPPNCQDRYVPKYHNALLLLLVQKKALVQKRPLRHLFALSAREAVRMATEPRARRMFSGLALIGAAGLTGWSGPKCFHSLA